MILDHINGVSNDHRLKNLRMVCPNCNSQLPTHCGKHKKKKVHNCIDCGIAIGKGSTRCNKCNGIIHRQNEYNKSDVLQSLKKHNWILSSACKELNISDNGLRKVCKRLGVDCKQKKHRE